MKHIKQSVFRAYYDGELFPEQAERVEKHLAICPLCKEKADIINLRGRDVSAKLHHLNSGISPIVEEATRQRLATNLPVTGLKQAAKPSFLPHHHPVWSAVTIMLVVGLMLMFAPIRALANDFLALFRIQKFEFVEFNPLNLPNSEDSLQTAAMEIERFVNEDLEVTLHGDPQFVDQDTAQDMTDFAVRFPDLDTSARHITLQPGFDMAMELDLVEIRTLLAAVGYTGVDLPETLDGAEIQISFGKSVVAAYGQCTEGTGASADDACTVFIQTSSPSVTAPPELDLQQLGHLYLQMLGMKSSQATRFSRNIDWMTTLVVPIPSTEATYKDVRVDGVPGTVIEGRRHNETVLMWVKDDIIYALVGKGADDILLNIANTLD